MNAVKYIIFIILCACVSTMCLAQAEEIPNRLIDAPGFMQDTKAAFALRAKRRITEEQFVEMSKQPNTIILDTRSAAKFKKMHIAGAVHLNFSDITADTLAKIIPSKNTRILIYCNNNIISEPVAFPCKSFRAPLNLPTFGSLFSYGYKNVYELGPVLNPAHSKIKFVKGDNSGQKGGA